MALFSRICRTIIFYFVINIIYRLMGKREVGQLGIVDLAVSILIVELAAISIDKMDDSIFLTLIPIFLLVGVEVLTSYISLKNSTIRSLVDGSPSVIIDRGKINFKEMVRQRYNLDDLLVQLREKEVKNIEDVDYAILESNGKLSVFQKNNKLFGEYPLPLILDGKVDEGVLNQIKKDYKWLDRVLKDEQVELNDIFYGFYRNKKLFIIKKSDLNGYC